MEVGTVVQLLFLLFYFSNVQAFTHSCDDLRNNYVGSNFVQNLLYACVVVQENFTNYEQLNKLHMSADLKYSFGNIARLPSHCVGHSWDTSWTFTSDIGKNFDCTQEFTLIMTTEEPNLILPINQVSAFTMRQEENVLAVPQTGMRIRKKSCTGSGHVAFFTGAGFNETQLLYEYRSWTCASVPDWIFSFDVVDTIRVGVGGVTLTLETSSDLQSPITVSSGDKIAVFSSGRSCDQQNLIGTEHSVTLLLADGGFTEVTVNLDLNFEAHSTAYVALRESTNGPLHSYNDGTYTDKFNSDYVEVHYFPKELQGDQIYRNQDTVIVEMSIGKSISTTAPTKTTIEAVKTSANTVGTLKPTTASIQPSGEGPYCNCAVDKFGFPDGWSYNDIWLDVVFILDTSEAMSEEAINDASSLIESFISDGVDDFLVTDSKAPFFTRVGVIAMADTATVLYNLNMTKADKVQATIKKGVTEIDVVYAFNAAQSMLNDGLTPERTYTRQVVYYITDSDTKDNLDALDEFKNSKGVIIVNNFLQDGEIGRPGLSDLASEGYYFLNSNYMQGLQAFCKANCFCKPGKDAYGGSDPAVKAAGGCYHATSAGVPFNKAKTSCATEGGILAVDHDADKGVFLQQLMDKASSKSDYFWIGYEKSDDGVWQWEDQSTDPYTNWDVNEPSGATVAKCAYVDTTTTDLRWGAGNCQLGFPYVCQYEPCSVGYKNC